MDKGQLFDTIDRQADELTALAQELWETPEVAMEETASARVLADTLAAAGFDVDHGIGDLPTAFRASYGTEGPRIGILGEYDALPGLSQQVATERRPVEAGAPGHGCGHNLHGVGAVGGAIAAKQAIAENDLEGTVVYFGCPAEETLVGKVYMARAGAFADLDAALAWHPSDVSSVRLGTANALDSIEYRFSGESTHAASTPESGRSALDAVQLLNTGVEYMREHIPDDARIHYVITDGGDAPNVVPGEAAAKFFVRSPERDAVARLSAWLDDIAEGAALMTQTTVERRMLTGCHGYLPSETIGMQVWENMERVGPIEYTTEDRAFAAELQATISEDDFESRIARYPETLQETIRDNDMYADPVAPFDRERHSAGTADLGDVCWNTPTVQFRGAAWPVGTPAHTWQAVAASGGPGTRAVRFAAKVFAGTVDDLLTDPSILEAAEAEHKERTDGREYNCAVPDGVSPPVDDA